MDMLTLMIFGSVSVLSVVAVYKWIRPKLTVAVNCWFCQSDFRVPFQQRNSFTCPGCDQYNGFTKDGDYNRADPLWYREVPSKSQRESSKEQQNGLCHACNLNQNLKVHQLAKFVPKDPKRFNEEVEEFSQHLDRTYRLCRACEAILHQVLGEQEVALKSNLLSYKIIKNQINASKIGKLLPGKSGKFLRIITRCCVFLFAVALGLVSVSFEQDLILHQHQNVTSYDNFKYQFNASGAYLKTIVDTSQLVTGCVVLLLSSMFISQSSATVLDLLSALSWSLALVYLMISNLNECNDEYLIASAFAPFLFALSSINIIFGKHPNFQTSPRKALPKDMTNPNYFDFCSELDDTATQDLVSTVTPIHNTSLEGSLRSKQKTILADMEQSSPRLTKDYPCDISTLSIDDYCADEELDLIMGDSKISGKPSCSLATSKTPLLRPAKFVPSRKVTKTSWVAGGYWQKSNIYPGFSNKDNLSRSSSQSSGFVSHSSAGEPFTCQTSLPSSSRPQSMNGDCLEKSSLILEPVFTVSPSQTESKRRQEADDILWSPSKFKFLLNEDQPKPQAQSSPILENTRTTGVPLMEREIKLRCSIYSIVLCMSVIANLFLGLLFIFYYLRD